MPETSPDLEWFVNARYGLFIHYGLYSLLGRGEWVMNRERIPVAEYARLAERFKADKLDFDGLLGRARKRWGMRYAILTTKHHDGFCLYDSKLTRFTAPNSAARRDLVAEFVDACRKHGLRIALYHSLNDWSTSPNAVDALERGTECYQRFIDFVHGQIREIMTNYGKVDVMWYDGWWPFDGNGWQARKLNAMVRDLQPGILINSRCGLPGDFSTPEQHVKASSGAWEANLTLNDNWGYHNGDHNWKSPKAVAELLRQCSAGGGNLCLNVGPRGDGSVPQESFDILDAAGDWLKRGGEAIFNTERFTVDLHDPAVGRSDFTAHGEFTASASAFYWHVRHWPGELRLAGVKCRVTKVEMLATGERLDFAQDGERLHVVGAPVELDTTMPVVFKFSVAGQPRIYGCGGHRVPKVPHCRYDPMPSDLPG